VHFLEILGFDLLFSHELVLIPEPNQSQPGFKIETDPQFHLFTNRNTRNAELQSVPGDLPIRVHRPFESVTENIIEGLIRPGNFKSPKQASVFLKSSFIAKNRDFSGSGVNPFVIVLMKLFIEQLPSLIDARDPLADQVLTRFG
jgi:hypothetical protein